MPESDQVYRCIILTNRCCISLKTRCQSQIRFIGSSFARIDAALVLKLDASGKADFTSTSDSRQYGNYESRKWESVLYVGRVDEDKQK